MEYRAKYKRSTDYTLKEIAKRFEHREIYLGASSSYLWIGNGADLMWVSKMLDAKIRKKLEGNIARTNKIIKNTKALIPQLKTEQKLLKKDLPALREEEKDLKIKLDKIKENLKVQRDVRKKTKDKNVFEETTEEIKKLQLEQKEIKSQYDQVKPRLDSKEKRYKALEDKIPYNEKKLESTIKANKNYNDYLKHYTPLLKRKVKEIYKRSPVEDTEVVGLAVIVEGKEEGNYWTKSEFLAGNWKKD